MSTQMDPFSNNWVAVRNTPDKDFRQIPYRDVLVRSGSWVLPDKWLAVIRYEDPKSGRIVERTVQTEKEFDRAIQNLEKWNATYVCYTAETMTTNLQGLDGWEDHDE